MSTEVLPTFPGGRRQRAGADVRAVGGDLPLQVRPDTRVGLAEWAGDNAAVVDGWLHEHGAVLFRGFDVDLCGFATVAQALAGDALPYRERSSPRTELAPSVYTSTDYPADQHIPLHNENSYQACFPARLVFGCLTAARTGGATTLADVRRVLARVSPMVIRGFARRGVRYVRNFHEGVGVPWQEAFQTCDRAAVEAYCAEQGITATWRTDGLRTHQVRPALARHPVTGERTWFNHAAFFHVTTLGVAMRDALVAQFGEDGLPTNTYYGDGTPIEPDVLHHLRECYAAETVPVRWRRGDVLLVDNVLAAHGREPFTGERRVVVSMGGTLQHKQMGHEQTGHPW
jgi:alpha-ketoglutarate-dependent taurine dioxygenase